MDRLHEPEIYLNSKELAKIREQWVSRIVENDRFTVEAVYDSKTLFIQMYCDEGEIYFSDVMDLERYSMNIALLAHDEGVAMAFSIGSYWYSTEIRFSEPDNDHKSTNDCTCTGAEIQMYDDDRWFERHQELPNELGSILDEAWSRRSLNGGDDADKAYVSPKDVVFDAMICCTLSRPRLRKKKG